ncbi:MAG TPA: fumarylacetoacetate hydrolase family protein, partial [Thermodesulfobacteriota bacterium]|nr:fumarylacetoacetate hydrolase family protein [Thermodesulfobacteriota bacterium]
MRINIGLYTSLILALLFVSVTAAAVKKEAEVIFEAEREKEPIPLLTENYPGLTLERAYEIQSEYVILKLGGDTIAGYKAGLTSKGAQAKFGVSTPVSGVLFSSGKHVSPASIDGSKYRSPVIETEIGFVVGKPIREKIADTGQLLEHIGAVLPVVEIPETGFADMEKIKAEDIIATNVGSSIFIAGVEEPLGAVDPDDITVALVSGDKTLNRGVGPDAMGDQLQALRWLVNSVVEHGRTIDTGSILITGSLGKVVPASLGRYEAR